MPQIDLNITDLYGKRWNLSHAVREVVANAEDVRRAGGTMRVEHCARTSTLTVTSEGQHLTDDALIFGETVKSGDSRLIGTFGDGLKVALAVFVRLGVAVKINTGRAIWTPAKIDRGRRGVIGVNARALPASQHRERVIVEVGGVTAADWAEWVKMFLFLTPPKNAVETSAGTLLCDAELRGSIFCRGVLVQRETGRIYGYDIPTLTLNRDREIADTYEVESAAREIWAEASASAAMRPALYDLLASPGCSMDVGYSAVGGEAGADIVAMFRANHGADAVPVLSSSEATVAGQNGRVGVVVPQALRLTLTANGVRSLQQEIAARREEVAQRYALDDLTPREVDVFQGALATFGPAVEGRGETMPQVEIVDFVGSNLGLYVPSSDRVLLARSTLSTPRTFYGYLAHEIAHRQGGDGDAAHRAAIEDIMGRVIAGLLGGA